LWIKAQSLTPQNNTLIIVKPVKQEAPRSLGLAWLPIELTICIE
jgi:hypothetical protein